MPPVDTSTAFMDLIENTTTVPITPNETMPFWDGVLAERDTAHRRTEDPLWAQVLVVLGGLMFIGAGSFVITLWAGMQ